MSLRRRKLLPDQVFLHLTLNRATSLKNGKKCPINVYLTFFCLDNQLIYRIADDLNEYAPNRL